MYDLPKTPLDDLGASLDCACSIPICMCSDAERACRFIRAYGSPRPLTEAERTWCLDEIADTEGYDRASYVDETDAALCNTVLHAWMDYCRDKGLR